MSQIKEAITLSFLADSLALGGHWIYDQEVLKKHSWEHLQAPLIKDFHPHKQAGELTHYGDQTLVLLQSLAEKKEFDLQDFALKWQNLFLDYSDYIDHATRISLDNFKLGWGPEDSGSMMNDLAGAARIFPLFLLYARDLEVLEKAAQAQTAMTHKHEQVVEASSFLSRVAHLDLPADQVLLKLGQTCHIDEAFPATLYLLLKFFTTPKQGLIANVLGGGDSAARGLILGFFFGLTPKGKELLSLWLPEFKLAATLKSLLDQF
ncbi:MAG: ADP-ribosylation/Crystallin J1 [Desulfonauticus sp. 38_4375]|nr:MAG: ADP-ribosylation/Crystallin J1 [Desulfonauticus sp. 38_4375]